MADTGATGHFITSNCPVVPCHNQQPIHVALPDGSRLTSTAAGHLPIAKLPEAATRAHIFPALTPHSLLSIGTLCDHGCTATFTATTVSIHNNAKELVLQGDRAPTGLWHIPLEHNYAGSAIIPTHNLEQLIPYLHACLFSPVIGTLIEAIQNNQLTTWPFLTVDNVRKYLHTPMATVLGHMKQTRKNQRSTKGSERAAKEESEPDNNARTHQVMLAIREIEPRGQIHSDQTGAFPVIATSGARYVMVVYDYDSNAIIVEALNNKKGATLLEAFKRIHAILTDRGHTPKYHRLDNEASTEFKSFLRKSTIDFQLVPPGSHRRNAAERAIQTFKDHFIAGLCSTDPNFPIALWDKLLPQAQHSLNLLRTSRINRQLSAYAQIWGQFDFNRTPFAPPGTRAITHDKPHLRGSWAPHGTPAWYIAPAMESYRCYEVQTAPTHPKRITDTIHLFPRQTPLVAQTPTEKLTEATNELTKALDAFRFPKLAVPYALPRVGNTQQYANAVYHNNIPSQSIAHTPVDTILDELQPVANHWPHGYMNAVFEPSVGKSLEYRDLIKHPATKDTWLISGANEFGRLAQGLKSRAIEGTNTIEFIFVHEMPVGRVATYARFVCDIREQKAERERTRLTVGGNLIDYPEDKSSPTSDVMTFKILVNSTLSTTAARMVLFDIKNYYLGTPLPRKEYMKIHISLIPQEIIDEYNLMPKVHNGYIYVAIGKGMYGLPQAGILANQLLARNLGPVGYYQARHTPGLWLHASRPISFVLVVDDFAVKYTGQEHADHLLKALRDHYEAVTVDWKAERYIGIQLKWDYERRTAQLSMPGYVDKILQKHQHPKPKYPVHAPHKHAEVQYGRKVQLVAPPDESPALPPAGIKRIQQVVGALLYHSRAVDSTTGVALSTLASEQSRATERTNEKLHQLLDYCATHPNATLQYKASDMILKIHSDAAFGNETGFRSRAGGHIFLGRAGNDHGPTNGAILNPTGIIRHVANSATEAEIGAIYINASHGVIIRNTLQELGHVQPPTGTPIITDNETALGFLNNTMKKQRSRVIDMRFHWTIDRVAQQQFDIIWEPGITNLADYYTKHHSPAHHKQIRSTYLLTIPEDRAVP